jgi:hypothetical protein
MTSSKPVQRRLFYTCYGGLLLLLLTISAASNDTFCELMWIEKRNNPGGPPAFFAANLAAWYNVFGTAADCVLNILTDGLLVSLQHISLLSTDAHIVSRKLYRCYIIWGSSLPVIVIPAIIYIRHSTCVWQRFSYLYLMYNIKKIHHNCRSHDKEIDR